MLKKCYTIVLYALWTSVNIFLIIVLLFYDNATITEMIENKTII